MRRLLGGGLRQVSCDRLVTGVPSALRSASRPGPGRAPPSLSRSRSTPLPKIVPDTEAALQK